MKILVTTSDQYIHLVEPHAEMFNKYWPGQDVTVLGFEETDLVLPDNFEYISLGRQENFGRHWTDPLIPYISTLEHEYFTLMMGDFFLTDNTDIEKVSMLEEEILTGQAEKAILDTHLSAYTLEYKPGIRKLAQNSPYRTTLHPAIWKREYFRRYLNPGLTAWDFEIQNMPESQRDGANIILPAMPAGIESNDPAEVMRQSAVNNAVKATNVYVKGIPIPRPNSDLPWGSPAGIKKEDILYICEHVSPRLCGQLKTVLKDGERYK